MGGVFDLGEMDGDTCEKEMDGSVGERILSGTFRCVRRSFIVVEYFSVFVESFLNCGDGSFDIDYGIPTDDV